MESTSPYQIHYAALQTRLHAFLVATHQFLQVYTQTPTYFDQETLKMVSRHLEHNYHVLITECQTYTNQLDFLEKTSTVIDNPISPHLPQSFSTVGNGGSVNGTAMRSLDLSEYDINYLNLGLGIPHGYHHYFDSYLFSINSPGTTFNVQQSNNTDSTALNANNTAMNSGMMSDNNDNNNIINPDTRSLPPASDCVAFHYDPFNRNQNVNVGGHYNNIDSNQYDIELEACLDLLDSEITPFGTSTQHGHDIAGEKANSLALQTQSRPPNSHMFHTQNNPATIHTPFTTKISNTTNLSPFDQITGITTHHKDAAQTLAKIFNLSSTSLTIPKIYSNQGANIIIPLEQLNVSKGAMLQGLMLIKQLTMMTLQCETLSKHLITLQSK